MSDWRFRDTVGVVISILVLFGIAGGTEGVVRIGAGLLGFVIAGLWIANFFLRGYTATVGGAADE